MMTEEKETER